jgi:hypothetical protein
MWAYAHMIFQNHDIPPQAFLTMTPQQQTAMIASDLVAAKHMKEDK